MSERLLAVTAETNKAKTRTTSTLKHFYFLVLYSEHDCVCAQKPGRPERLRLEGHWARARMSVEFRVGLAMLFAPFHPRAIFYPVAHDRSLLGIVMCSCVCASCCLRRAGISTIGKI